MRRKKKHYDLMTMFGFFLSSVLCFLLFISLHGIAFGGADLDRLGSLSKELPYVCLSNRSIRMTEHLRKGKAGLTSTEPSYRCLRIRGIFSYLPCCGERTFLFPFFSGLTNRVHHGSMYDIKFVLM